MHHRLLVLSIACVTVGSMPAFAQEVIAPYADAQPQPPPLPPSPPSSVQPLAPAGPTVAMPPVPPPIVAPPPPYCGPQYYCQSQAPRIREVEQPRYGLMIAGLALLGASWSINAAVAYAADEWRLAVPVVGPFFETQNIDTSPGHEYNRPLVMLLVFDGLVETAGAVMFIAGAASRHRVRVYDRASVSVVPTAGYGRAGLAAFGSF
jgi:hypothetical protein